MERSVSARLTANVTGLVAGLSTAGASVKSFATEANAAVASNKAAYRTLSTGLLAVGAAAATGFGLAAREAIQWETAFAGVRKTVDDDAEGLARLERELRDLSLVLPATAVEIAGVAEAAGQLNVARKDIVEFTRVMIMLGNTTNLSANDAATGLARFMNILGTAPEDVGRLGATLVDLGNKGASTEAEILALGVRMAGVATIAGLSEAQVLGLANAMSSLAIPAEEGGSAITRVFTIMDDAVKTGGANLGTFAAVAGVSAAQFAAAFRGDPTEALLIFLDGLNATTAAGQSTTATLDDLGLADLRVSDTLRRLGADTEGVRESLDDATTAWEDNNALVEEAAKRYETTESKIQLARNALTDAGIDIGNKLLPMIVSLADHLASLAGWFTGLNPAVQNTILALLGFVAAGGLIGGMAIKAIASLTPLITTLRGTAAASALATTALRTLGAATIVGALIAVAFAVSEIVKSMDADKFVADTNQVAAEIIRFGLAGQATGAIAAQFGEDLQTLRDAFAEAGTFNGEKFFDMTTFDEGSEDFIAGVNKIDEALAILVRNGDIESASAFIDQLGLSVDDARGFFTEYAAALDAVDLDKTNTKLKEGAEASAGVRDEYGRLLDATGNLIDPTQEMSDEAQHLADKWNLSAGAAIALAEGIDAIVKATEDATDPTRDAQAANIAYEESLTGARETLAGLVEEMLGVDDIDLSTVEGQRQAWDALKGVLADTATGFDLTSTAGQTLARVALDIADKASINADAILATTDNTADYRAALQDGYDDLVAFYIATGHSADEAKRLADEIIKVPPVVPIDVPLTPLQAAHEEALKLGGALDLATRPRIAVVHIVWDEDTGASFGGGGIPEGPGGARLMAPPEGGRVAGSGAAGADATSGAAGPLFAGARGVSMAAFMAGGPGWTPTHVTAARAAAAPDRPAVNVDARTINNYPIHRESSEHTMQNLAKTSVFLAAAVGPTLHLGPVETR